MTGTSDPSTRGSTTRRTALKLFGGLAGVGGATALGLGVFAESGRAAVDDDSFTAADVQLESDDGLVTDVWLQPDLSYAWTGLNSPPAATEFTVEAETPGLSGSYEVVGTETDTDVTGGTTGSDDYAFADRCSLMDGSWTPADFQPQEGGEKTTGPIQVRVTAALQNADANSPYTDTATAEFSVIVDDGEVGFGDTDGTGVSGEAGTGGSTGGGSGGNGGNGNGNGNGNGGNGGNGNGGNGNGNGNGGNGNGNGGNGGNGNGNGNGGNGGNGT